MADCTTVFVDLIKANPLNKRSMEDSDIQILADNIYASGTMEPVTVYHDSDNKFVLLSGHRRVKAWKRNLETHKDWKNDPAKQMIPCIIVNKPDNDLEEMKALSTANIHRSRPEELRQEVSLANTQWNLLGAEDKKAKTAVFKQSFIDRNSNNPRYLNDPEHFIKNNFRPRLEYIRQVTGLEIANDTIKNALSDCLERSSEKPVTSTAAEEGVEEALSSEAGDGKEKKKSEKKPMSANKILKALKKIEHDLEDYSNVTGNDNVLVTIGKTTDAVADLIDTIMACEDTAV